MGLQENHFLPVPMNLQLEWFLLDLNTVIPGEFWGHYLGVKFFDTVYFDDLPHGNLREMDQSVAAQKQPAGEKGSVNLTGWSNLHAENQAICSEWQRRTSSACDMKVYVTSQKEGLRCDRVLRSNKRAGGADV